MKVAAIIPALNEEHTIGTVIKSLREADSIDEVIVVDDASTDRTAHVAESCGARVISHQKNKGKGLSMIAGAHSTDADILFFADADLVRFTSQHARMLIEPIVRGEVGMTVGLRDRGRFLTWLLPHILPVLGGERAMRREDFLAIAGNAARDFGIETTMNAYCRKHRIAVRCIVLVGVGQVVKEKKYGLWKGFFARMLMYGQIIRAEIETLWMK